MQSTPERIVFDLHSEPVRFLRTRDPKFSDLIDLVGPVSLDLRGTPYSALVRSIVGQQISGTAAASIWRKLEGRCGAVTPERVSSIDDQELRAAGLSRPKVAYLRDLTGRVVSREIDLDALPAMSEEDLVKSLTAIHGIGVWTAQMFMIFCLGRLDVFAPKDLGLRAGIKWLYGLPAMPAEKESMERAEVWRPYRTVASLYLWQAVTRKLVVSQDPPTASQHPPKDTPQT
ncbi:MAG: DNA-3-methyladenine glycosylase family protein [Bacillota bacterium]